MSTVDKVVNRRSYVSSAQLYTAIRKKQHKKFIQFVIEKQHDINYQIPKTNHLQLYLPELIGGTSLHFALSQDNFESFHLLLKHGADYNVKNYKQMTVLHRAIEENFNKRAIMQLRHRFNEYDTDFTTAEVNGFVVMQRIIDGDNSNKHDNWRLWGKVEDDKYVNSIISASLKTKNVLTFSNDDAISLFHAACLANNIEAVKFFLKNGADSNAPSSSQIFGGFTPLHFAVKYSNVEVVKVLLDSGANLLSHQSKSMSPVDMLVDQNLKIMEWLHAKNKLPYTNSIIDYLDNEEKLKAIMDKNFGADWTGFSNFHVACTMSNVSSVPITCSVRGQLPFDKFLEGDHWHAHDRVSSIPTAYPWSGFTALHFAAFFNIETAKLLIKSDADIEAENKFGVSPINILETRATIGDLHSIVSHKESWKCIVFSDGKTRLVDLISSMKNHSTFENFLDGIDINIFIPDDAPLWPGYTVLHLTVTFSETVKKVRFLTNTVNKDKDNLIAEYENCCKEQEISYLKRITICRKKNADVTVQDTRGRTPLNLAFRLRSTKAINLMLHYHDKTANPTDDDNLSHLHIACSVKGHYLAEKLLANGADANAAVMSSFKWQCDYRRCTSTNVFDLIGSTPLHLSASSEDLELAKVLLTNGADVNTKDNSGLTPLHRTFILRHVWQAGNERYKLPRTVRHICRRGRRVGIPSFYMFMEVLHNLISELLSAPNLEESIVDDFGLSHLHVAVYNDSIQAVKKLLNLGSDMNSVIRCPKNLEPNNPLFILSRYEGYTPLNMANNTYKSESENFLLERGVDFLAPRVDGKNQLFEKLKHQYPDNITAYVNALKENEVLRTRLQDEFGWTILHVACQLVNVELANFALSIGVDVNFRTNEKSPLHPGLTALHVLMSCYNIDGSEEIETILSLLLANDADVMLANGRGDTAIHRTHRFSRSAEFSYAKSIYTGQLLQYIRNFSVNPTNHEGISVFHIACIRHNVDAVKKFLDQDVDVNEPVEFFSEFLAGFTPLHFAVSYRLDSPDDVELQLRTVELLLKRGANVNAVDAHGDTPIQSVAECDPPRDAVYEMIVRHGADINVRNNQGRSPLEYLLSSSGVKSQELEFLLEQGCRMNGFNEITQVGYMSYLYEHSNDDEEDPWPMDTLRRVALSCPSICETDYRGRTVIHNLVSSSDYEDDGILGYFVERGYDIDCQDESGMTALHLTAQFRNSHGVEALLSYGCDVNVIDFTGRTPFAYTLEPESLCETMDPSYHNHHLVIESFARFIHHMNLRSLHVNDVNKRAFVRALGEFSVDRVEMEEDYENIRSTKIGDTAFVLEDFLSETKAIVRYSKIAQEDREVIEQFFTKTIKEYKFHNWDFLCKLQYRKALQRAELVESAKDALNIVIEFPLPDLCYDVVEKFLSNLDLKSLMVAATLKSYVISD